MDRHLQAILLKQRGQNGPLVAEVIEKLSPKSKELLFRLLRDMEDRIASAERKVKAPWSFR